MSRRRSPRMSDPTVVTAPAPTAAAAPVQLSVKVPSAVTTIVKRITDAIWDPTCPFASLFAWMMGATAIYYMFLLPDISVRMEGDKVKAEKVTKNLRGWLFLATVLSGIVGYQVIHQGCKSAGSQWSVMWFIVAFVLSWFITRLILASVEKTTISNASDILKQLN